MCFPTDEIQKDLWLKPFSGLWCQLCRSQPLYSLRNERTEKDFNPPADHILATAREPKE